jgi:hypothetical protein
MSKIVLVTTEELQSLVFDCINTAIKYHPELKSGNRLFQPADKSPLKKNIIKKNPT